MIAIIAALTRDRVIGKGGTLPWRIPEDLQQFKRLTAGKTVIMGRKTFESIGRPLPDRRNIVVSTTMDNRIDVEVCADVPHALRVAQGTDIFVIGGASVYEAALPLADTMYLSWVKHAYEGDTRFPPFDEREWEIAGREDHAEYELVIYRRKPHGTHPARS